MVITLWKCEYCLVWALNKSILFGSNSLKVSVLCDMDSEKRFYYSLMWKELSESVIIAWYELWKSVWYHLVVTPWNCQYCLIWDLKRYLLLLVATIWKEEYFYFFVCFSCMYCLTIRMVLIQKQFRLHLVFLKLF